MGGKESKNDQLFQKEYGFSTREIEFFKEYSNNHADPFHNINRDEFKNIYSRLNPQLNDHGLEDAMQKAFSDIDDKMHDYLRFDEFIIFLKERMEVHLFYGDQEL